MIHNYLKEVQSKLTKSLLHPIVLQYLDKEPAYGYQLIAKIRKDFGIYLGPSTVYPFLDQLEKKRYVKSAWDMAGDRPRKIYTLTTEGKNILKFAEDSLALICKNLGNQTGVQTEHTFAMLASHETSQRIIVCQR